MPDPLTVAVERIREASRLIMPLTRQSEDYIWRPVSIAIAELSAAELAIASLRSPDTSRSGEELDKELREQFEAYAVSILGRRTDGRPVPSPQGEGDPGFRPGWHDGHAHEWQDDKGDWDLGGNRSMVECKLCGVPGERNDNTGEVHWPAT